MATKSATRAPRKSRRFSLTPEERKKRMDEAHARMMAEVQKLTTAEGWKRMITARARLSRLSFNNMMMVFWQYPEATDIRTMAAWNRVGRRVIKGSKAIRIWEPYTVQVGEEEEETEIIDGVEYTTTRSKTVTLFRLSPRFDISQTEPMDPKRGQTFEPYVAPDPVLLKGAAPDEMWDLLAEQVTAEGFTLERGYCGTANGITFWNTRVVRIRPDVEDAQAVKTLAHELAHILLDHEHRYNIGREVKEVEAESVACIVADVFGLNSLPYSVPYVAGWGGSVEAVQSAAEMVLRVADEIIRRVVPEAMNDMTSIDPV